jgi:hypothetical protein
MESVYHIVTIRVNETSWAHVWRLRSHYLGTGYDNTSDDGSGDVDDAEFAWSTKDKAHTCTSLKPIHRNW